MNKHAPEALKWIVNILKTNKVPFRISGGLAVKIYGSKRDLDDIDIDIPDKAIIKRKISGECWYNKLMIMELIATLLPEPVAPAINK